MSFNMALKRKKCDNNLNEVITESNEIEVLKEGALDDGELSDDESSIFSDLEIEEVGDEISKVTFNDLSALNDQEAFEQSSDEEDSAIDNNEPEALESDYESSVYSCLEDEERRLSEVKDSDAEETNEDGPSKSTDKKLLTEKEPVVQTFSKKETKLQSEKTANHVSSIDNNSNNEITDSSVINKTIDEKSLIAETTNTDCDETSKPDEYEYDSSDEEDIRNTIGNIPIEWYNDYPHIGYDWDGKKILKPASGDHLDEFLEKMDNPDYWRTVKDEMTGQKVVLSYEDVDIIRRIQRGRYPDATYNPYEPFIDFFTYEKSIHPVSNRPESKESFIPSLTERKRVNKLVHAIKMGLIKKKPPKEEGPHYYMLWKNDKDVQLTTRMLHYLPAPKLKLPGHGESYNPPPEYRNTIKKDGSKIEFEQKYKRLRQVKAYSKFIKERFERCLDLYLCPRQRKVKLSITPEDLLPKLPKPKDLQPFPTTPSLVYKGHEEFVRTISVESTGQFLASGSDDKTVRIWEVSTARCLKIIQAPNVVKCIAWCPNTAICLLAFTCDNNVYLVNPGVGDKLIVSDTDKIFQNIPEEVKTEIVWKMADEEMQAKGYRLIIEHFKPVKQVTWHCRGDYFAVVMPDGKNKSVMIHQLTKRRSQNPFKKTKGLIQCVMFHPSRPYFFLASQRYVRVYNLLKQELNKKLLTNSKWVSSIAIHPQGDNVIVGGYDCRVGWFDLDLSTKPYKLLRHHKRAVRQVCFHKRYPLFASASDDGTVIVCHGMVYNDLLQNPLIVPVKILRGHSIAKGLGVLDCQFHPTQPWLFSSGADTDIRLFT